MNRRIARLGVSSLFVVALAAGASAARSATIPILHKLPLQVTANRVKRDVLGANMLTTNKESLSALITSPLNKASFEKGPLHRALLDPRAREVMATLVECALGGDQPPVTWSPTKEDRSARAAQDEAARKPMSPLTDPRKAMKDADAAIVADPGSWSGSLGLCRDWATNAPSEACQEVVSACLLARNNAEGVSLGISLRGDPAITPGPVDPERGKFPWREGAFFGNLFLPGELEPSAEVKLQSDAGRTVVDRPPLKEDTVVYKQAYACGGSNRAVHPLSLDVPPDIYMQTRVCGRNSLGVLPRASHSSNPGCIAVYQGTCEPSPEMNVGGRSGSTTGTTSPITASSTTPPLGPFSIPVWASTKCSTTDDTYQSCKVGSRTWSHPLTVFLSRRDALVQFSDAALEQIKSGIARRGPPQQSGATVPRPPEAQRQRTAPPPPPPARR
ncbi:hypothetical protein WME76_18200 [Sorangium sp. So ce119]|uniref:hypothetical protein n=1 Tax=Sorangium sp. So ce119 TaxID=3133279 RepID=UPI003F5ED785